MGSSASVQQRQRQTIDRFGRIQTTIHPAFQDSSRRKVDIRTSTLQKRQQSQAQIENERTSPLWNKDYSWRSSTLGQHLKSLRNDRPIRTVHISLKQYPAYRLDGFPINTIQEDYGFSIRGGAEHGIGIYIPHIENGSVAEKSGIRVGDQILNFNGTSFIRIFHAQAAKVIQTSREAVIQLRFAGRVPGAFETHQTFLWTDARGRPVSPPPEVEMTDRYDPSSMQRSGFMMLRQGDERKVHLVVKDSRWLGVSIRGGNEFGLGIYVSGVDKGSVSQYGELKVGDQVLDANGVSFLDISHKDAIAIFTSSKHLVLSVKDVGKVPHSRATHDVTSWVKSRELISEDTSTGCPSPYISESMKNKAKFSKGIGSQLMLTLLSAHNTTQISLTLEKAKRVLQAEEFHLFEYYFRTYRDEEMNIVAFSDGILSLLDDKSKAILINDIRCLVNPCDLDVFDDIADPSRNQISTDSEDSEVDSNGRTTISDGKLQTKTRTSKENYRRKEKVTTRKDGSKPFPDRYNTAEDASVHENGSNRYIKKKNRRRDEKLSSTRQNQSSSRSISTDNVDINLSAMKLSNKDPGRHQACSRSIKSNFDTDDVSFSSMKLSSKLAHMEHCVLNNDYCSSNSDVDYSAWEDDYSGKGREFLPSIETDQREILTTADVHVNIGDTAHTNLTISRGFSHTDGEMDRTHLPTVERVIDNDCSFNTSKHEPRDSYYSFNTFPHEMRDTNYSINTAVPEQRDSDCSFNKFEHEQRNTDYSFNTAVPEQGDSDCSFNKFEREQRDYSLNSSANETRDNDYSCNMYAHENKDKSRIHNKNVRSKIRKGTRYTSDSDIPSNNLTYTGSNSRKFSKSMKNSSVRFMEANDKGLIIE